MKVLIVTPYLGEAIGGMERFVIEFSKELVKQRHEVTILCARSNNDVSLDKVKVIRKKIFAPHILNKLIKYIQLSNYAKDHLKKNKYDLVLAMGHSGIFLKDFVWRASGSPIPLIFKQRDIESLGFFRKTLVKFDLFTQKIIEGRCIKKAKYHMFPSLELKKIFEKSYDFSANKYFIPCSGIGISNESANDIYDWKSINDGRINILIIGSLGEERKGRKVLLEALPKLDKKKIRLLIVGTIDPSVEMNALGEHILFGKVKPSDMPQIYRNSDIFVFPSLSEGFPNVLLEASYYNLPTISSKLEGVEEYFTDKKDILLVDKNDSKSLAREINKLVISKKDREGISKALSKNKVWLGYPKLVSVFLGFIKKGNPINLLSSRR